MSKTYISEIDILLSVINKLDRVGCVEGLSSDAPYLNKLRQKLVSDLIISGLSVSERERINDKGD